MHSGLLLPQERKHKIDETRLVYSDTSYESHQNISPNDAYARKTEVVLLQRKEKETIDITAEAAVQFVRSEY
jgi:hypothetical protein